MLSLGIPLHNQSITMVPTPHYVQTCLNNMTMNFQHDFMFLKPFQRSLNFSYSIVFRNASIIKTIIHSSWNLILFFLQSFMSGFTLQEQINFWETGSESRAEVWNWILMTFTFNEKIFSFINFALTWACCSLYFNIYWTNRKIPRRTTEARVYKFELFQSIF